MFRRRGVDEGCPADPGDHTAAHALETARHEQLRQAPRGSAKESADGEEDEPGYEEALPAQRVAHRPRGEQEGRRGEDVHDDDPLDGRQVGVEVVGDGGDGDIGEAEVGRGDVDARPHDEVDRPHADAALRAGGLIQPSPAFSTLARGYPKPEGGG